MDLLLRTARGGNTGSSAKETWVPIEEDSLCLMAAAEDVGVTTISVSSAMS
jgi:hypothetical protein